MTAILKVRDKTTGEFVGIPAIRGERGPMPDITPLVERINTIADILRSGSTPEQTKAALIAMGNGYQDLYTIANTLKTFLESADTADTTINTWREIETFLQGITDMSSLTSLLAEVESNIFNLLSAVATTNSYNDLDDKPHIPAVWTGTQVQYDAIANKDAATLYFILDKPSGPS